MPLPVISTPGTYDLTLYQGSDLSVPLVIAQDAAGTPWDLTGCSARAKVRPDFVSAPILALTAAVTDAAAGAVTVSATVADISTVAIPGGTPVTSRLVGLGEWDLELFIGSNVIRVLQGTATLSREATT